MAPADSVPARRPRGRRALADRAVAEVAGAAVKSPSVQGAATGRQAGVSGVGRHPVGTLCGVDLNAQGNLMTTGWVLMVPLHRFWVNLMGLSSPARAYQSLPLSSCR